MTYNSWDVVAVRFPFTDEKAGQKRPALVLSSASFSDAHGHTLLAMITSAANAGWPSDVPITDLMQTGLKTPSVVRMKWFTLPHELLERRIGMLSARDSDTVFDAMRRFVFGAG